MFVWWLTWQRRWHRLVEEGHREVTQIEKARFDFFPFTKMLEDPLGRLFGKSALPCTA
jgi:hypothetical protein